MSNQGGVPRISFIYVISWLTAWRPILCVYMNVQLFNSGSNIKLLKSEVISADLAPTYFNANTRCSLTFTMMCFIIKTGYSHCYRSWSAQAWKLLGNVHMCPSQCQICAQHVYKLGHSLYTRTIYCLATSCTLEVYTCLDTCVHFQAVSKLGHSNFYSSVIKEFIMLQLTLAIQTQWSQHSVQSSYSWSDTHTHTRKFLFVSDLV